MAAKEEKQKNPDADAVHERSNPPEGYKDYPDEIKVLVYSNSRGKWYEGVAIKSPAGDPPDPSKLMVWFWNNDPMGRYMLKPVTWRDKGVVLTHSNKALEEGGEWRTATQKEVDYIWLDAQKHEQNIKNKKEERQKAEEAA